MDTAVRREMRFSVDDAGTEVSAILLEPPNAKAVYVFAHGAGAGMRHVFLEDVAARLATRGIATFRYQFPYVEAGKRRPDPPRVAHATVRAAVKAAQSFAGGAPVLAGGKSFGGRMTSQAQAERPLESVRALVFLGFPLHAAGKPGRERAAHLARVEVPMLFLQGTRDELADLAELRPVLAELGSRAILHVVEGGDHSFKVPKRAGRSAEAVMDELATTIDELVATL